MNAVSSNLDRFFARLATLGGSGSTTAASAIVPPIVSAPVASGSKLGGTSSVPSSTVSVSDAARLRASLFDLRSVVNRLNSTSKVAGILTTNTNSNLTGSVVDDSTAVGTNNVTVTQKAQAQRLQSQALPDATLLGPGTLSVQFGSYNAALNSFTPDKEGSKSVAIGVLDSSIDGVTNVLNRSNLGLTAKVVQDAGASKIELTGNASGREQAFKVDTADSPAATTAAAAPPQVSASDNPLSGNDKSLLETVASLPGSALAGRSDIDLSAASSDTPTPVATPAVPAVVPTPAPSGLSRLNFDPTVQAGDGAGLTQLEAAQDAIGTVNGKAFTASSNQVTGVLPGANLQITAAGSGTIQFRRDPDQAINSARTLVDSFNQYRSQTSGNSNLLAQQLGNKVNGVLADAEGRSGNDRRTLAEIGVERGSDGSLKLNEDKFKQSFAQNSESTVAVIDDAASRLGTIADDALNGVLKPPVVSSATNNVSNGGRSANTVNDVIAGQLRVQQFQTLPNIKPSLITYTPTTSNLYGLAQYLAVGGL